MKCVHARPNNNQLIIYYQSVHYLLKTTTIPYEYYLQYFNANRQQIIQAHHEAAHHVEFQPHLHQKFSHPPQ